MTLVPAYNIFFLSATSDLSFIFSLFFTELILSPVRIASSTVKFLHSIIRISALILSPDSKRTTSPFTRVFASITFSFPSLKTLVFSFINSCNASALCSAFIS